MPIPKAALNIIKQTVAQHLEKGTHVTIHSLRKEQSLIVKVGRIQSDAIRVTDDREDYVIPFAAIAYIEFPAVGPVVWLA